jgi:hypothetical protein
MDDVVARAQVCEALERPSQPHVGPRRPFAEDLRVGEQHEAELAQDEAAPRGRHCKEETRVARKVGTRLEQLGLEPAQERLRPQGLAPVSEGDDNSVAAANEPD